MECRWRVGMKGDRIPFPERICRVKGRWRLLQDTGRGTQTIISLFGNSQCETPRPVQQHNSSEGEAVLGLSPRKSAW